MDAILEAHLRDLAERCERQSTVTCSAFLTPLEQRELEALHLPGLHLWGGHEAAERKLAFFLPFYITPEELDYSEYLSAFRVKTPFQSLSHRDYLGAILNLGIERKCLGDLYVEGDCGYFYAIPSVSRHLLLSLDRIGRGGAKVEPIAPDQVPAPKVEMKEREFTVKSMRLDAVAANIFGLSRTQMQEAIAAGLVTLNYAVTERTDAPVGEGDLISVRGKGKAQVLEIGGKSKKDRLFLRCGLFK